MPMDAKERDCFLEERRTQGAGLARRYRLNLRQPKVSGANGNWLGVGIGSSVDFQDHRPYAVGDDPRYINWQAYARSGEYTMKLYRDEVSPAVDLVFDCSLSMCVAPEKLGAALALFYFCAESVVEQGGALKCYAVDENACRPLSMESVLGGRWLKWAEGEAKGLLPKFESIPWRPQSARILVSDLLYPGMPNELLPRFGMGASWKAIVRVYSQEEENPSWNGGMKLVDSETKRERILYCDQSLLEAYRLNYEKHFSLWNDYARRNAVALLSVKDDLALAAQLGRAGVASGLIAV
ncbi:DUF58 domain-containing protein [Pelagicoccus sp. SDUM812005]|uniref:DUF58 domain-containing protein n=1 Tax=Pelagicoccus sp. SDUM812005 TaxID=3041257 RepID=UPI00280DEF69|nr:DUF58 domain-containing protein [Pelagicoccus sp. SDUM812005]MDQ8182632.1 DUF58 domain-containing protein [Pelagicoccus sp. SDUM812005]